ncbi:hypothetical protein AAHC03_013859 [Spirometra sp. Aus1]
MSLVYCAIACGKRVLCEQSVGPIDFSSTARQYLDSPLQEYVTFAVGRLDIYKSTFFRHTFNSFNRNGLSFIAIADASTSQQQTLNFLRLLESKYTSDPTRVLEAHSGSEHCHQIDFGRVLATEMANFSQQDQSKVMELRSKVADVSLLMQNNIVDLEKRGAKLDDLFTKTEAMESEAAMFQTTARQVKQKHYWDNCRTKIILFSALFVLVLIIVLIILWQTGVFEQK